MLKKYCYVDGEIVESKKARVAINDLAVLRGYGVFDFLKTVNGGQPFLWREHWQRFLNSARALNLRVPLKEADALVVVKKLLAKNKCTDASIRLLLTGGPAADGITIAHPVFYILLEDLHPFPQKVFTHGAKVITYDYQRQFPLAKNTNYLTAVYLQKRKQRAGAIEILYTNYGQVLECSTSNFFLVKQNKIITAKDRVLYGTVRNAVIKLTKKAGIKVEERVVKVAELKTASEAFLTATNKDVTPVVKVDDLIIGNGKVGPVTKKLLECYREFVQGY